MKLLQNCNSKIKDLRNINDNGNRSIPKIEMEGETEYVPLSLFGDGLKKYLRKERQQLKDRFSSTLSITNPDHSSSTDTSMIDSCDWELSPITLENFKVFDDFFN